MKPGDTLTFHADGTRYAGTVRRVWFRERLGGFEVDVYETDHAIAVRTRRRDGRATVPGSVRWRVFDGPVALCGWARAGELPGEIEARILGKLDHVTEV